MPAFRSLGTIGVGFRAFTGGFTSGINKTVASLDAGVAKLQSASLAGFASNLQKGTRSAQLMGRSFARSGLSARTMGLAAMTASSGIKTVGFAAAATTASLARLGTAGLAKVTRGMRGFMASVGGLPALLAGLGTIGVFKSIVGGAENFNRAMTNSLAIMGNVAPELRTQMEEAAFAVAKTTKFSAKEAAEAYFFLASAGLSAAESVASMPKVAAFAQAGNFDLARATDLLTDAQSALGLVIKGDVAGNAERMQRVSDVLVKANTLANASVEQFSESLTNKAGAALKIVGKDIAEGAAVLAAFADQGVKGADAGTALNIVFRDLQTKALKNADAFREAGIAVFDSAGEMNNIADIISDVETRLDGMSDAQAKAQLLQLGFTDKSVAFIQTLIGTSEKIRGYEMALRDAGGTTAEVAAKQMTPFQAAVEKLSAAWEKFSVRVGTPFLEGVAAGLEQTMPKIEAFLGVLQQDFTMNFKPEDFRSAVASIVENIGVLADTLHVLRIGFNAVQAAAAFAMGAIAQNVAFVSKQMQNLFTGTGKLATALRKTSPAAAALVSGIFGEGNFDTAVTDAFAGGVLEEARKQMEETRALIDAPLPSERFEEFQRRVQATEGQLTQNVVGGASQENQQMRQQTQIQEKQQRTLESIDRKLSNQPVLAEAGI